MFGHFMIRGEFVHYDFGTQSINFPNSGVFFAGNVLADSNAKITVNVARGGISYKF